MPLARIRTVLVVVVALLAASACGRNPLGETAIAGPPTTLATTTPPVPSSPSPRPAARALIVQAHTPFATIASVTVTHPSARVERIGYHEANHDGARQWEPLPATAGQVTMEARNRGTGSRTAADVVVDPESEIRAPVTGRVVRAATYVLYCKYSDDIAVIEPDDRPGWQVKMLHISGVQVRYGQRVTAGQTVIAPRATQLPFASQVDELRTVDPAWPHVHMEVIDPSIPDIPNPNSGGC